MADKNKGNVKKTKKELQSYKHQGDEKKPKKSVQLTFDTPSEKMIHQILPFVFVVLAILLEVCFVLASVTADAYVGVAGLFLKNFFLGLFGLCAFLVPLLLLNLAANWRKFVDSEVVISKVIFSILFLISLSGVVHIYLKPAIDPDLSVFILPRRIFEYSYSNLLSSGLIGGFICECVYALFKSVGTTILMFALTLIFLIFSLGMTPRNMGIWLRYRLTLIREKRQARIEEEKQAALEKKQAEEKLRAAELARIEAETKAAEDARKKAEDEKVAAAEKLAIEREMKEKERDDALKKVRFVDPDSVSVETDVDDGQAVDLDVIFKEPPRVIIPPVEVSSTQTNVDDTTLVAKKDDESSDHIEVEVKEMTEIDTYRDDNNEQGSEIADEVPREYVRPTVDMLHFYERKDEQAVHDEVMANAALLTKVLQEFKVGIQEISYSRGPSITRYEIVPDAGIRIRSIENLAPDISMRLAAKADVRIAPIPNKSAVGIEVANKIVETVDIRSLLASSEFQESKSVLTVALGKDIGGNNIYFDIGKMPHLLIAGTTGSGKSVCINCAIMSILFKASPRDVKLILIDPKKVEFQPYRSIPHLYAPIVTEPKKAAGALAAAVAEMERRFALIESVGAKNIVGYNKLTANDPEKEHLPYIVIIIDELADLMMTAADDVETAICRIAQKARAAGIHLIIGTQRPSVDVVTGLIKANIPSRIAFAVASQVDSKTILDTAGADKLLGMGDMLFAPIGSSKPVRLQGAFIDDEEVLDIVEFINDNNDGVCFNDDFIRNLESEAAKCGNKKGGESESFDDDVEVEEGGDPKFKLALDVAIEMGKISTSLLQRRLEIGYGRAAKLIDKMERMGYVSAPDGNKPRTVLVSKAEIMERRLNGD